MRVPDKHQTGKFDSSLPYMIKKRIKEIVYDEHGNVVSESENIEYYPFYPDRVSPVWNPHERKRGLRHLHSVDEPPEA